MQRYFSYRDPFDDSCDEEEKELINSAIQASLQCFESNHSLPSNPVLISPELTSVSGFDLPKNNLVNCPICMEDVDHRDAFALQCSHVFHRNCVMKWLNQKKECPICREEV